MLKFQHKNDCKGHQRLNSKPGVGGIFFLLQPFSVTCYLSLGLVLKSFHVHSLGQVILRLQHMLLQTFSAGTLIKIQSGTISKNLYHQECYLCGKFHTCFKNSTGLVLCCSTNGILLSVWHISNFVFYKQLNYQWLHSNY